MSPKHSRTFFVGLAAFVLTGLAVVTAAPALASSGDIRSATNSHRTANGRAALESKGMGAQGWAEKMLADWIASGGDAAGANPHDYMKHNSAWTHKTKPPVEGATSWGENVAWACDGSQAEHASYIMGRWKNSAGHNANMLNSGYTHLGVGWANDGQCTYAVQRFATFAPAPPAANPPAEPPAEQQPAPAPTPKETPKPKKTSTPAPEPAPAPEPIVTPSPSPSPVVTPSPSPSPDHTLVARDLPTPSLAPSPIALAFEQPQQTVALQPVVEAPSSSEPEGVNTAGAGGALGGGILAGLAAGFAYGRLGRP